MLRPFLSLCLAATACTVELASPAWIDRLRPALTAIGQQDLTRVPDAARGEVDLELDESLPGLRGTMRLRWTNPGPDAVPDLMLNCWPNAAAFNGAQLTLSDLRIDGMPAQPKSEGGGERLRIPLAAPLPAGASLLLESSLAATISTTGGYHGLMTRSPDGVWVFSAFVPEVDVFIDGAWRNDPLAGNADALRTRIAHWLLRLRVPAAAVVAGPGSEIGRTDLGDGRVEVQLAAPLARNLCVVVGEGLQAARREVDGVQLRMWHRPAVHAAAELSVSACAAAMRRCSAAFGAYPWSEFDAVEAPLEGGVGGVEASGLVLIGRDLCEMTGEIDPTLPPLGLASRMLAEASAHETCHQWWHLMVGSDTMQSPWLDESLTNWGGTWVLEAEYGTAIGPAWGLCVFGAMMSKRTPAVAMTLPAGDYDEMSYGGVVYARGALMYQHLRIALGDERFFAALRDWSDTHRFAWAEPADWQAWLDKHAPPELATEIRTKWLSGEGLTQQDLTNATLTK
jgi:hypothetical protein